MKQKTLYAIVVIVIIAIAIFGWYYFSSVGKMIWVGEGGGGYRYYWNCSGFIKCSDKNPGNCTKTSRTC
ncbi:MAG: hypothetical protein QXK49_01610 [Candidatus Aenigmatarchaeota archaeon]